MTSEKGGMELVTLRLEEETIDSIDYLVEESTDYDSRSDFIRQALDEYSHTEPDYEMLLDAAYRAKSNWEASGEELSNEMVYSLGEHIGKLEILNEIDSL